MKLIFLHQAKAGGATLRNILNNQLKWLCLDDIPTNISPDDIYKLCLESDIIYSMSFCFPIKERLGRYYESIESQSILLTHVRSPINLFESEWRYELQKGSDEEYASTHLPHDPIFNKGKIGEAPSIRSMLDYLERDKELRISINEWFEYASKNSDGNSISFPIAHENNHKNTYWYRSNHLYRPGFSIFNPNKQYKSIINHFSESIMEKDCKPDTSNTAIIIPTEMLSDAMAAHIYINKTLRSFTKLANKANVSYEETLKSIRSLKVNETELSLVNDESLKLNNKNRMIFYSKSYKDYKLWTTALENNLHIISQLKGK